jgi:hypothetical protein
MQKFSFKISLEATSEKEAQQKMASLTTLASKLSNKELNKLSEIVKENGETLKMAKNFLGL